jgi:hypothetical protein
LTFRNVKSTSSIVPKSAVVKEPLKQIPILVGLATRDLTLGPNSLWLPLKFFLEHSIPELFTTDQAALWTQSLGSRCTAGSALYHAALAVAYAHELFLSTECLISESTVALEHYQQALTRTNVFISKATSAGRGIREEVALACMLFICFELLSGHDEQALYHLEGGSKIINDISDDGNQNEAIVALSKTFLHLDLQALAFIGQRRFSKLTHAADKTLQCPSPSSPISRADFNDFLMTGHQQIQRCCHFIRNEAQEHRYDAVLPEAINEKRLRQLRALERCLEATRSPATLPGAGDHLETSPPLRSTQKLQIVLLATMIKLSCCLSPQETSYDAYESQFLAITEVAEDILNVHSARPIRKRFTLHCSVVEPLYFTACKCRNSCIRRRAIQHLKRAGQQGGWNGATMAGVAEKIVELEENRVGKGSSVMGAGWSYGIDDVDRVHGVDLKFSRDIGLVKASCLIRCGTGWEVKTVEARI